MSIEYVTKYPEIQNIVDEKFKLGSKTEQITNRNYSFTGGKSVKIYNISTGTLNDYSRTGSNRYGIPETLNAGTEEITLTQDKSFTFVIDKMDEDETKGALNAGTALSRQIREVVIPTIDTYRLAKMATGSGTKAAPAAITKENITDLLTTGSEVLDDNEVPVTDRYLVVSPKTYKLMKSSKDVVLDTEIGQKIKLTGVVSMFDGAKIIKVPTSRLPSNFGFMWCHPIATPSPVKLSEYKIHIDPPGISGALVEGRIYYDAFVLSGKANAIYLHNIA